MFHGTQACAELLSRQTQRQRAITRRHCLRHWQGSGEVEHHASQLRFARSSFALAADDAKPE